MSTLLPQDSNSQSIPVMRLKTDGAHMINAVTAASARNSTVFAQGTRVVSVYADVDVYMTFGDSSVTAGSGDHYFPAGLYYDFAIGNDAVGQHGYVAVKAVSEDGNVYISERN